jgi:putative ABC transport system substrate-binding protein
MHFGQVKRREFIALLGGATAWPLAARAQQPERMRRVGVLMNSVASDPEGKARFAAFSQALQQLGWIDGRNVRLDVRWVPGADLERFRRNAVELVALASDVIVTTTTPSTLGAQQTTRTVPIVFAMAVDPMGTGFVESLARPGGNITGFMQFEYTLSGKWLELLKQIAPIASSRARSPPTCRCRRRRSTSWSSTSRRLRPLASTCRPRCWLAPMR